MNKKKKSKFTFMDDIAVKKDALEEIAIDQEILEEIFEEETIVGNFQIRDIKDGFVVVNVDGRSVKVACEKELEKNMIGKLIEVEYTEKDPKTKKLINGRVV